MGIRTQQEIEAEKEHLREVMPTVRHFSAFGDDNRKAIQAQIDVLENDYTDDEIYDEWENDQSRLDNALEARAWLDGVGCDSLVNERLPLVQP